MLDMPGRTPRNVEQLAAYVRRVMKDKELGNADVERKSKRFGHKITSSYVGMILNGTAKNLTIDKLQALAAGLEVPFESVLFAAAGIPDNAPEAFRQSVFYILYLKAEKAAPEERTTILELVELLNERLARRDAG